IVQLFPATDLTSRYPLVRRSAGGSDSGGVRARGMQRSDESNLLA
ncbi:unnamed protein product, partial [Urochloa humidicola]